MIVLGLFVVARPATHLIGKKILDHKARGVITARFVFLLNYEMLSEPVHTLCYSTQLLKKQVIITIPKLYSKYQKWQKDANSTSFCHFLG